MTITLGKRVASVAIVDDDPDLQRMLLLLLERRGFAARSYLDPLAALNVLGAQPPDIILLDLTMPAMTGFEFLAELRLLLPLAPFKVIIGSGKSSVAEQALALAAGASCYIEKPYHFSTLVGEIKRLSGG